MDKPKQQTPTKLVPINLNSNQISRSNSQKSFATKSSGGSGGNKQSMNDYKPLNVLVFKNGDQYDPGLEMSVTRKQFKNWINLLDYLTDKLKMSEGAVHKLYAYPSGTEIRHFTEMEEAGRYFVAANTKYKEVKYGKYPRLPNFNTFQTSRSPRQNPPTLNSTDSLEYYLKSHGFKPKLGDVWQDTEFNLMKKQKKNKSSDALREDQDVKFESEKNEEYANSFSERRLSPERSRSEFNTRTTANWEKEKTEFEFGGNVDNIERRNFSAKRSQSVANVQQNYDFDKDYNNIGNDKNDNFQYDQRRYSATSVGGQNFTQNDQRRNSTERLRTAIVTKKRNIKLQTEPADGETSKSAEHLIADQAVNTDDARFEHMKKEKSFVNDYLRNKEMQMRREKEKPPMNGGRRQQNSFGNSSQRNFRNESLERLNRQRPNTMPHASQMAARNKSVPESKVPKNKISSYNDYISSTKKQRNGRGQVDKSPRWAEELTVAVRELSTRVDQLSARSRPGNGNGLFDEDED